MNRPVQNRDGSFLNWLGLGFLALLVVVLVALSRDAQPATEAERTDFHLTVLHTNDTWGYLLPCG